MDHLEFHLASFFWMSDPISKWLTFELSTSISSNPQNKGGTNFFFMEMEIMVFLAINGGGDGVLLGILYKIEIVDHTLIEIAMLHWSGQTWVGRVGAILSFW